MSHGLTQLQGRHDAGSEHGGIPHEPVLVGDGLFKAKGKLTIWVTDDARHMPVKMQSKIPVGSIKAELVSKS